MGLGQCPTCDAMRSPLYTRRYFVASLGNGAANIDACEDEKAHSEEDGNGEDCQSIAAAKLKS